MRHLAKHDSAIKRLLEDKFRLSIMLLEIIR